MLYFPEWRTTLRGSYNRLFMPPQVVDFDRMRVKPRTLFDVSVGIDLFWLFRTRQVRVDLQLDVRNFTNAAFAYNFANPFSGTHFGHPRLFSGRVRLTFPNLD